MVYKNNSHKDRMIEDEQLPLTGAGFYRNRAGLVALAGEYSS